MPMTDPTKTPLSTPSLPRVSLRSEIGKRFSLLSDKAEDGEISRRILEGVELQGATPWILVFAIFVASIGLNVNSTAVIIGAMLISPLMGPIMGIGHGVAIYDFELVKRSFLNLGVSALISLVVSTGYFLISPLSEAQSELLARTSPTLWDVLIAFFGGLAGIVGITRRERSNVVPGVAIATALMPPLCTAGFGLATGRMAYFAGAFYLFSINCVFIAVATVIGIRLLGFPQHSFVDAKIARKVRSALWIITLGTALPSAYLASRLVKEEVFKSRARQFIRKEFSFQNAYVIDSNIDPKSCRIDVSLMGTSVENAKLMEIEARLASSGLMGAKMTVHQVKDQKPLDITAIKSSVMGDLLRDNQALLEKKDQALAALQAANAKRDALLGSSEDIFLELKAQSPGVTGLILSQGFEVSSVGEKKPVVQMIVKSVRPIRENEKQKLLAWSKVRMKSSDVHLSIERIEPSFVP